MANGQHIEGIPLPAGVSHLVKPLRYLPNPQTMICVQIKDDSDNLRFGFLDGHDTVLFVVAIELVIAQHPAILDGLTEAEFDPLR